MPAIDRTLPEFDVRIAHQAVVDAPPEEALAAALAASASPDPLVRVLLRLRGLSSEGTMEDLFSRLGLAPLAREPLEVVLGAAGRPWRLRGEMRALEDARPGSVRIAVDLRADALGMGRTRLSTETRVAAVDERARRAFARYWRLVGPFSSLLRRRWLAQVQRSLAR